MNRAGCKQLQRSLAARAQLSATGEAVELTLAMLPAKVRAAKRIVVPCQNLPGRCEKCLMAIAVPVLLDGNQVATLLGGKEFAALVGQLIQTGHAAESRPVARAKEFIREHLTEPMSLGAIARHACLCAHYLCGVFRHATGMTLGDYIARSRVDCAKRLLLDANQRIIEVAFAAGFESIPTFNRLFKKLTGKTPTSYRAAQSPSLGLRVRE